MNPQFNSIEDCKSVSTGFEQLFQEAKISDMASRKRSGSGSKRQLKEKIVQIYESFFKVGASGNTLVNMLLI